MPELNLDPATALQADRKGKGNKGKEAPAVQELHPVWDRVQPRNDRVLGALSGRFRFTPFEDTLRDTVAALIGVGGLIGIYLLFALIFF